MQRSNKNNKNSKKPAQRPQPRDAKRDAKRDAAPAPADPPLWGSVQTGADHLHLLPRDSAFAWAWWEVTADGFERARKQLSRLSADVELVLQIRSGGPRDFDRRGVWELPVTDWLGDCCVPLGPSDAPHFASIGLRVRDASAPFFVAIARSNVLLPPPGAPSDDASPARWATAAELRPARSIS